MVTTEGHQFSLLDLSMWRDISLPPEDEVVVRVHVDSSGWMGWGNGPCYFCCYCYVFSFGWRMRGSALFLR